MPALEAPIVAVTVYPDRARITRRLAVRVQAGEHRLDIGPLPLGLHRDSVRVSGRGAATVLGVDVVTRHRPRTPDRTVAELEEQRRTLAAEVAAMADVDEVEERRADFIDQLAQRAGGTYARALAAGQTDVAAVTAFADSVAEQLGAGKARRREIARHRELTMDRLAAVERRLAQAGQHRDQPDRLAAAVTLGAGQGGADIELDLSYVVDGAGWQSTYDVRVNDRGDTPALVVTWFGLVTQHTGEDWPECDLRLSTARPAGAIGVPELDPWFLDRRRPLAVPPGGLTRGRAIMPSSFGAAPPPSAPPPAGPAAARVAEVDLADSVTTLEQGVSAATYRPVRPVAVPADGTSHRATVAVVELPAVLDYITAPVRAQEAHLRAVVLNESPHTLLPGRAAVFHGGDFVGATQLPVWAPGEEVELALGIDDRVRVERELIRRTAGKSALTSTRRRDVEYRVTVANHTPRPARVTVLDQAPVARDEGITVRETLADPPPAQRTDLGVLTWRLELQPGERGEITFAVRVELAKGVELSGWRE